MFRSVLETTGPRVRVMIDGREVEADEGETVAAVLARLEPPFARINPVNGERRAPYCMMGVCFECLVRIDGADSVQSCQVAVRDGMRVERQTRLREVR